MRPEIFETKVKKHCDLREGMPEMPTPEGGPKMPPWMSIAEKRDECKEYAEKVKKKMLQFFEDKIDFFDKPSDEPFASIAHNDLWVNNTMQKLEDGKIIKNIIVDFQIYQYANPLLDVIFFIFSSVQRELVKEHLEDLVQLYEDNFFKFLEDLKCDTSKLERNFLKQLDEDAPQELIHLLFMAIPILGPKNEYAVDFEATDPMEMVKESSITQEVNEQIVYTLVEFGRRNWIKD